LSSKFNIDAPEKQFIESPEPLKAMQLSLLAAGVPDRRHQGALLPTILLPGGIRDYSECLLAGRSEFPTLL
jgi:hypothetical protein